MKRHITSIILFHKQVMPDRISPVGVAGSSVMIIMAALLSLGKVHLICITTNVCVLLITSVSLRFI